MDIDVRRLVPRFILADRNGMALAKAIEAGMRDFLAVAKEALDNLNNPDEMPEWRLDEVAWEYSIPYDYTAAVEIKREWIRNAYALSRLYGTAAGVEQYLKGYFEDVALEEAAEYGGDPFHFRISLHGEGTAEKVMWAVKAARMVKNVRSVMENMTIRPDTVEAGEQLYIGTIIYGSENQRFTAMAQPDLDGDYRADGEGNPLMDGNHVAMT